MASLAALRPDTFRVWLPNPEALMSLKPTPVGTVPELTSYVARAAFPDGNPYTAVRDALGTFYDDERFAALFPDRCRPAEAPWRLALVTVLQFAEGLSDRQAAEAVRGRIDWKYALGLELTDPGFDSSVLCEFRSRLVNGRAELQLLDALLERCRELGLIRERGRQRTDSTHVLAAVRVLNRPERVGETLRAALYKLAVNAPRMALGVGPCGVVPTLLPPRRELPRAQGRRGPRGSGPGDRRRRGAAPGRRGCGDRSAGAGAAPGGVDLASCLGRAVHGRPGPVALARGQGHAPAGRVDQLTL